MKNVYVISRIIKKNYESRSEEVPSLGVHKKQTAANEHFNNVIKDRMKNYNSKILVDQTYSEADAGSIGRMTRLRRITIQYLNSPSSKEMNEETIYLEKWKI
jgi:hypothetical protein